ncbi:hypothetical protein KM539_06400 [Xanthomonas translucens pv. poae]|nr:hypothetical protein [Xanthomonas translucens]UKE63094.1 hypothetical protein KM539_06400 [Xanthomonas translucens pv. poae]
MDPERPARFRRCDRRPLRSVRVADADDLRLAQGNPLLATALLDGYGMRDDDDAPTLRRRRMAAAWIRPDCDRGVCMQQVPVSGPRGAGERIALQMFPV